jgi:hypothetical protein
VRRLRVLVRKGLERELEKRLAKLAEGEQAEIRVTAAAGDRDGPARWNLRQRSLRLVEQIARQQGYGLYIDAAEVLADGVRLVVRRQRDQEAIEEASRVLAEEEGG